MKNNLNLGGSVVSNHILEHTGNLKWCVREKSINDLDNGWRFFSDRDTEDYLLNPSNMSICSWDTIVAIEPAILAIFDYPIGTELELIYEKKKKIFVDSITGERI